MSCEVLIAEVSPKPIDPTALLGLVTRPQSGATALFVGQVRDHDPEAEGEVVGLDYTCHPSAGERISQIAADVLARLDPGSQTTVALAHRVGRLGVGEVVFVVAVSAPHRREAFEVCEGLVEQVKSQLPIWKQQFEADGSYRWPGVVG